jgi:hypothetical protein
MAIAIVVLVNSALREAHSGRKLSHATAGLAMSLRWHFR